MEFEKLHIFSFVRQPEVLLIWFIYAVLSTGLVQLAYLGILASLSLIW